MPVLKGGEMTFRVSMYFVKFDFSNITQETANKWEVTNNSRKRPYDAALVLRYTRNCSVNL